MAALTTLAGISILLGISIGVFLKISFAIRRDDHDLGSIRFDAPNRSARAARDLVGISASRWDRE